MPEVNTVTLFLCACSIFWSIKYHTVYLTLYQQHAIFDRCFLPVLEAVITITGPHPLQKAPSVAVLQTQARGRNRRVCALKYFSCVLTKMVIIDITVPSWKQRTSYEISRHFMKRHNVRRNESRRTLNCDVPFLFWLWNHLLLNYVTLGSQ